MFRSFLAPLTLSCTMSILAQKATVTQQTDNSEEIMKKLDDVLSQIGEEEVESE